MCELDVPLWQHWMHWWASEKQERKYGEDIRSHVMLRMFIEPTYYGADSAATDQDEGMQDTCDAVGVVTVWVVAILPFSSTVTIARGFFLLHAPLNRKGRVTQLQAVLVGGNSCQSSWPPVDKCQRIMATLNLFFISYVPYYNIQDIFKALTDLNSPRLLTTLSSGQKEALFSSTTISTVRDLLPLPVETTHSHSPLASTCTSYRISSLDKDDSDSSL